MILGYSDAQIWVVIFALGLGTFLIRFSFLGVLGGRDLPEWLLRHLRYTPVAVLPGMVAPLVLWPAGTGGEVDPARLLAALVTVVLGLWLRNMIVAILGGAGTLFAMLWLLG
jgi:branched-subunit amino acid transport protein